MSTAAQDEFDHIFNKSDHSSKTHPEDRYDSHSSPASSDHDGTTLHSGNEGEDRTPPLRSSPIMPSATYIPTSTQFDANTGPKGVIADARSFETAKKRSFRQTLYAFASGESPPLFGNRNKVSQEKSQSLSPSPEPSDDEDEFMRTWRANRLQQLASMGQEIRTRRQSPSKRRYGSLVTVDPAGYLDAVEKVSVDTVVVVLIYDDESAISGKVEDALKDLARKHPTTRFVKLHYLEAEMDEVAAPGVLAYRGGDCFANLVSMINEMPAGRDINSASVESVLQRHKVLM